MDIEYTSSSTQNLPYKMSSPTCPTCIVQTAGAPRTKRQRSYSSGRRSTKGSSPGGPFAYLRRRMKTANKEPPRSHSTRRRSTKASSSDGPLAYLRQRVKALNKKPRKTKREFTDRMQTEFPDAHIHTKDSPKAAIRKALKRRKQSMSRLKVAVMTILGILTAVGISVTGKMLLRKQQTHYSSSSTANVGNVSSGTNTSAPEFPRNPLKKMVTPRATVKNRLKNGKNIRAGYTCNSITYAVELTESQIRRDAAGNITLPRGHTNAGFLGRTFDWSTAPPIDSTKTNNPTVYRQWSADVRKFPKKATPSGIPKLPQKKPNTGPSFFSKNATQRASPRKEPNKAKSKRSAVLVTHADALQCRNDIKKNTKIKYLYRVTGESEPRTVSNNRTEGYPDSFNFIHYVWTYKTSGVMWFQAWWQPKRFIKKNKNKLYWEDDHDNLYEIYCFTSNRVPSSPAVASPSSSAVASPSTSTLQEVETILPTLNTKLKPLYTTYNDLSYFDVIQKLKRTHDVTDVTKLNIPGITATTIKQTYDVIAKHFLHQLQWMNTLPNRTLAKYVDAIQKSVTHFIGLQASSTGVTMEEMFQKTPVMLTGPLYLYRVETRNPYTPNQKNGFDELLKKPTGYTDTRIKSCSFSPDIKTRKRFTGDNVIIYIPPGTKLPVVVMGATHTLMGSKEEYEVLLPPNLTYKTRKLKTPTKLSADPDFNNPKYSYAREGMIDEWQEKNRHEFHAIVTVTKS